MNGIGVEAKRRRYEVDVNASTFVGPPKVTGTTHTCSDSRAATKTHIRIYNSLKLRHAQARAGRSQAKSTQLAVADITT